MDRATYESFREAYTDIYEMDYQPPPKPPAEVRTAKQPESRKPPTAGKKTNRTVVNALKQGMKAADGFKDYAGTSALMTGGAALAGGIHSKLTKKKKGAKPDPIWGGGSKKDYDPKKKTGYTKSKSAFQQNKEAAAKRLSKSPAKKSDSSSSARASLEKSFKSSSSSGSGTPSYKSKSSEKASEDKKKSDAYFKKASDRYNQGGGGNREQNQKKLRKDTHDHGMGRAESVDYRNLYSTYLEMYHK